MLRQTFTFAAAMALLLPTAAQADRPEKIRQAKVVTAEHCPLTPDDALDAEKGPAGESLAVATIFAGLVGAVVQAGATALGDALEQASQEEGIVAEGSARFYASRLLNKIDAAGPLAKLQTAQPCLILYSAGEGELRSIFEQKAMKNIASLAGEKGLANPVPALDPKAPEAQQATVRKVQDATLKRLAGAGLTSLPDLYVEARLVTTEEAVTIRPVLIWYRKQLAGAPKKAAETELHASLATPGAVDIGTVYGAVRILLPEIAPGNIVTWSDLKTSPSLFMPARPTAGFVDTKLAAANAAYTAVITKKAELAVATRAVSAAKAKLKDKDSAEAKDAVAAAEASKKTADDDLKKANDVADGVKSMDVGATNIKLRFVVVRKPNEFGLAIAKALKGQAEALGKAATGALTPKSDWAATDTAYLTSVTALSDKQREYDAAVSKGDSAAAAKLSGEVLVAKAKLNEAAAALNKPLPYPSLLDAAS